MLARCSRCRNTFFTDRTGLQQCPKCGTDVVIDTAPRAEPESGSRPPGLVDRRTPWERRNELGVMPALGATLQQGLAEPAKLFDAMDPRRADALHVLFLAIVAGPLLLGLVVGRLLSDPLEQLDEWAQLYELFGQPQAAEQIRGLAESLSWAFSTKAFVVELVLTPVAALAFLYVVAGATHVLFGLFGEARGGFAGTLKATVYAQVPAFLVILPGCGAILYGLWATALQIYGLSRVHESTVGTAAASVITLHAVFFCCLCGLPALLLGLAFASLA